MRPLARPAVLAGVLFVVLFAVLAAAAPAASPLRSNGDGTVTDLGTGLTWVADQSFAVSSGFAEDAVLPRGGSSSRRRHRASGQGTRRRRASVRRWRCARLTNAPSRNTNASLFASPA